MKPQTLQEFHAEVKKLADRKGKPVSVAKVELSQYTHTMRIEFSCYVEGYSFYSAPTAKEAIAKLKAAMFPVKRAIPIVEVTL